MTDDEDGAARQRSGRDPLRGVTVLDQKGLSSHALEATLTPLSRRAEFLPGPEQQAGKVGLELGRRRRALLQCALDNLFSTSKLKDQRVAGGGEVNDQLAAIVLGFQGPGVSGVDDQARTHLRSLARRQTVDNRFVEIQVLVVLGERNPGGARGQPDSRLPRQLSETLHEERLRGKTLGLPLGQPPPRQSDAGREDQGTDGEGQEGAENAGSGCHPVKDYGKSAAKFRAAARPATSIAPVC